MRQVPTRTYTHEDVARWLQVSRTSLPVEYERIKAGDIQHGRRIFRFSRKYENLGLTHIASGELDEALGCFAASAAAWSKLLEIAESNSDIEADLLDQASAGFLLAMVSGDQNILGRMITRYERYIHTDAKGGVEDRQIGLALSALCQGDVELASARLVSFRTFSLRPDTIALMESIVNCDTRRFAALASERTADWRRRIREERLGRYPDAVCDHYQIGWVRLAERVCDRRPEIDLAAAGIPLEIFHAAPKPVEGML